MLVSAWLSWIWTLTRDVPAAAKAWGAGRSDGTQVVVTPAGDDDAVRPTVPVKPPLAVKLIVEVADPPAANETLIGFATRPKSGPPGRKNSTGEFADTSFCPRFPPPQTSSIILARE